MARKQCHVISILLGIMFIILVDSNCPDKDICDCTEDYINCTCHQSDPLTFEKDDKDPFSGKEIIINGCEKVILKKLSLENLETKSVYISDLQELEIESFAFYQGIIENLHISNIEKFTLETQGFSNIKNVTNIMLKNVTIRKLDSSIFSGSFLHFILKDSHIGTAVARSLHMDNWESILIENNTFREIEVSAIRISNASRFSFVRNSVEFTQGDSFAFISVKEVDFGHCRFRQIATNMILIKEVDMFSFHNNYIRICEEMAFKGVHRVKEVNFVENQILVAKDDSLIPNYKQDEQNITKLTNENNEIGCNCNIEWLLSLNSEKYNRIKEKNTCHDPPNLKGLSLSLLQINVAQDGNCSTIGISTTTEVVVTTILTKDETAETLIADPSTMASMAEGDIGHNGHSIDKKPTNEQQVSCKDKHKSTESSGNKHQYNTILLFVLFITLMS